MVNEFCGFKHGVIGTDKMPADTTLNNMKKADLIKLLHTAQHNYETLMYFYNNAVKVNMSQLNNGWIEKLLEAKENCSEDSYCSECPFGQIQDRCILAELQIKGGNNGWIPCSERLPDKQGSYLIQDNHNNIKVAYYDYNTQHTYRAWWIDYTKVNVVAWCELPAPYKEGVTENE